jgi:PPM family protein phosphatase
VSFRTAHLSVGQAGAGDDRFVIIADASRVVIAVCDGAGGTGRGGEAAELVISALTRRSTGVFDAVELLRECDVELAQRGRGAETTAVIVVADAHGVTGASVGDSGAWVVEAASCVDLTHRQSRKPLLGSGEAVPVPFESGPLEGTLLVATDGLLKYASTSRIRDVLTTAVAMEDAAAQLLAAVRLRSSALQDDFTVALCRPT